jgi:hypothetical protein
MSFAFGRPSFRSALRCVTAPNLQTCGRCGRALRLRCGRVLGCPTCGRALRCVGVPNLRTSLVLRLCAHLADVPCVCVGVPNLGEAILKSLPPSQNLFLSILQLVF